MSDFETAAEVSAYYQGHQHGAGEYMRELSRRKKAERLLTDLIAELRGMGQPGRSVANARNIKIVADRAEARLKGLNDE
jgi:hypothetical protein